MKDYDPTYFFVFLIVEHVALACYLTLNGRIYDFTDAPRLPKSWLLSTYLEENDDRRR
jgi:hypothetical protein